MLWNAKASTLLMVSIVARTIDKLSQSSTLKKIDFHIIRFYGAKVRYFFQLLVISY